MARARQTLVTIQTYNAYVVNNQRFGKAHEDSEPNKPICQLRTRQGRRETPNLFRVALEAPERRGLGRQGFTA